jgi:hypothetical protein
MKVEAVIGRNELRKAENEREDGGDKTIHLTHKSRTNPCQIGNLQCTAALCAAERLTVFMGDVQENTKIGQQAVVKNISRTRFIQLAIYAPNFIEWQAIFACFDCPVLREHCRHGR